MRAVFPRHSVLELWGNLSSTLKNRIRDEEVMGGGNDGSSLRNASRRRISPSGHSKSHQPSRKLDSSSMERGSIDFLREENHYPEGVRVEEET
ncbi:hypothetical protein Tco_0173404 [Tanacetum coccineum]